MTECKRITQVCYDISSLWEYCENNLLHIQDWTNADILWDSGFKLSDIIVVLCSKLLDYILLKSGSITLFYSGSRY